MSMTIDLYSPTNGTTTFVAGDYTSLPFEITKPGIYFLAHVGDIHSGTISFISSDGYTYGYIDTLGSNVNATRNEGIYLPAGRYIIDSTQNTLPIFLGFTKARLVRKNENSVFNP